MKKLFLTIGLAALATVSAVAQPWQGQTFLGPNVLTLGVSNKFFGVTNFLSPVNLSGTSATNATGMIYTNRFNQGVIVTNSNNALNLLGEVSLYGDREGRWYNAIGTNAIGPAGEHFGPSAANISIRVKGTNAAANAAINFTFAPVPCSNEVTTASQQFVVGVTANGTTPVVITTNFPSWKYIGVRALRLITVVNVDTDADSYAWVEECSFNGFKP